MKKILLIVAVCAVTIACKAATVSWGAVNLYGPDGVNKYTGTVELLAVVAGGDIANASTVESVTASATGAVSNHTVDWTSAVVGQSYDFYYQLSSGDKSLVSSSLSAVASDVGAMTVAFGNQANYTKATGNWKDGGSVPEPTTGLLVLLGMAGLALKRKVA